MLRGLMRGFVDIVYPKACLVCRKNLNRIAAIDNLVCMECWGKIKRNLPPFCYSCGRHLEKSNITKHICPACVKKKLSFDRAFSPCRYEGVIKELIHTFKYQGKDHVGRILSKLMTEFIREYDIPMQYIDFIVPVPLHKTRLREREFNQAEVLGKCIAEEFNKAMASDILCRHRPTKTQTDLAPNERFLNVKGSFSVNRDDEIKGKNLLLVDDVLTTAATSSEAACALKDAGCGIVFVLTLAN